MKDIKALIENINSLLEDDLIDEFEDSEIMADQVIGDMDNTTEQLNAKTKISRALDILVDAIEDFKNTAVTEIDLISDADLGVSIEHLDTAIANIRAVLNNNQEIDMQKEDSQDNAELISQEEKEEKEEKEEVSFDDEALLDLFPEE